MTVQHIVVFRWKAGTTAADVAAIEVELEGLPGKVPSLVDYRHGPDLALGEGRWDFGIVASFADVEGWRAYDQHPDHHHIRAHVLGPHVAERAAVQIGSPD